VDGNRDVKSTLYDEILDLQGVLICRRWLAVVAVVAEIRRGR